MLYTYEEQIRANPNIATIDKRNGGRAIVVRGVLINLVDQKLLRVWLLWYHNGHDGSDGVAKTVCGPVEVLMAFALRIHANIPRLRTGFKGGWGVEFVLHFTRADDLAWLVA